MSDEPPETPANPAEDLAVPPAPSAAEVPGEAAPARPRAGEKGRGPASRGPRPDLEEQREPVYREAGGFRLCIEARDLAKLRELPGAKGKSDRQLAEDFFDGLASRFAAALAEDLSPPLEIRVIVDPYSRQAFLASENRILTILSF